MLSLLLACDPELPSGAHSDAASVEDTGVAGPQGADGDSGGDTAPVDTGDGGASTDEPCTYVASPAHVSVSWPSDTGAVAPDLSDELRNAVDGAVLAVGPGVWPVCLDFEGKEVTLVATDGPEVTELTRAEGCDTLLTATSGETAALEVSGFQVSGGGTPIVEVGAFSAMRVACGVLSGGLSAQTSLGAAATVVGGTLTLDHMEVRDNTGEAGAIYVREGGSLVITDTALTGNQGGTYGGAIRAEDATVVSVVDSRLEGNFAVSGAAIFAESTGTVEVAGTTIRGHDGDVGAALYLLNSGDTELRDAVVEHNDATSYGGAVFASSSALTVTNSTFSDNSSGVNGGAIYAIYGPLNLYDSTFTDNTADYGGGAVAVVDSTSEVIGNDFCGNYADEGGALYASEDTASIRNNRFVGNTGVQYGGGVFAVDLDAELINNAYMINVAVYGGAAAYFSKGDAWFSNNALAWNGGGSAVHAGAGSMSAQPSHNHWYDNDTDPLLDEHPTPSASDADPGFVFSSPTCGEYDLRLAEGSPLIAAGNPDYPNPGEIDVSDIGAYGGPAAEP